MDKKPIRILQIADTHLFRDKSTKIVDFNPYQSLKLVVDKVLVESAKIKPSLIVLTGDTSQDFLPSSYAIAKKFIAKFNYPILITLGNHDYAPLFIKTFGDPTLSKNKLFSLNNWRIILLNSHYPEHTGGFLAKSELDFLASSLNSFSDKPVMIFLHHQVLPIGCAWLDQIKLVNSNSFFEIIDKYNNIKAVVCGHVHQDTKNLRSNVFYFSTPATSWQFAVGSKDFKLDSLMPGYRWFDLYDDGSFVTEVARIDYNKKFIPNLKSTGY